MLAARFDNGEEQSAVPLAQKRSRMGKVSDGTLRYTAGPVFWTLRMLGSLLGRVIRGLSAPIRWAYAAVELVYPKVLAGALRQRALTLMAALGIFAGTAYWLVPQLGVSLIPEMAQGEFLVEMKLPPGRPIERTDVMMTDLQGDLRQVRGVNRVFAVAGTGNRLDASPTESGENIARLLVQLERGVD